MKVRWLGALLALSVAFAFATASFKESPRQAALTPTKIDASRGRATPQQRQATEAGDRSRAEDVARWVSDELKRKMEAALRDAPSSEVGEDWGKSTYAAVLALPPPPDPRTQNKRRSEEAADAMLDLDGSQRTNASALSIRAEQVEQVYERLYAASASLPEPLRTRRLDYLLHRIAGHDELPEAELDQESIAADEKARLARILKEEKVP